MANYLIMPYAKNNQDPTPDSQMLRLNVGPSLSCYSSPQQGDLRLLGPPSGRGADGRARTRDRRVPADLRADPQATVLPTSPNMNR
ncbi:hypothetical protein PoB_002835600 [Plakobranchus ocellatus]|uniref:Uncharacterized protein n=1 Tax=Plakobranchus ocellatus TaxID=259542 RepID=A0AAV4A112_9GAST|nr:hypothetical protein PoB_002835600 [Plakobranchus ocellatus]